MCFIWSWRTTRRCWRRIPQLAGKLGGSSAVLSRYRTDDAVDLSEKTLVVDWYYKKRVGGRTVLHYCKYVGETVLYATENDTFMPSVTREARDPETGETVLVQTPVRAPACERGLYDDGEYPFIFDRLFPIEGSICGYGYIDIGKGAQEQIDRMDQAIVKNTIMAATPRWFRPLGRVGQRAGVCGLDKAVCARGMGIWGRILCSRCRSICCRASACRC